jgi:hypothetical protein
LPIPTDFDRIVRVREFFVLRGFANLARAAKLDAGSATMLRSGLV